MTNTHHPLLMLHTPRYLQTIRLPEINQPSMSPSTYNDTKGDEKINVDVVDDANNNTRIILIQVKWCMNFRRQLLE